MPSATGSVRQRVIELKDTTALLLAGPGCGKTHILAQRIVHARAQGVPWSRMLCLTFTNRAARHMRRRVEDSIGNVPETLFVGNLHRFCLRFLFANALIPEDSSILDDDDRTAFVASLIGTDNPAVIKDFLAKAAFVYQTDNGYPDHLLRRPQSPVGDNDYANIESFARFKADNHLLDFDDILLRAYTALLGADAGDFAMTGYSWVQVDEVQDLTPLQLAIIEKVTRRINPTVLYMGDEQQAIFSFTGAGGRALDRIKNRCAGHVFHLRRNFRAPGYLVEFCNSIAHRQLGIPIERLPIVEAHTAEPSCLFSLTCDETRLPEAAAERVKNWLVKGLTDIAVLVRTNAEGRQLSEYFAERGIPNFLVSESDVFHSVPFKTVRSHLTVVARPWASRPWARLLFQCGVVKTLSGADKIVRLLRENAICPSELLEPGRPGPVERLAAVGPEQTIVVLDTETTGLDVFSDDIVQLSAVKIRLGTPEVEESLDLFISTDKALPPDVGGAPNPLLKIYTRAKKSTPEEAFKALAAFIEDADFVAGHNLDFDLTAIASDMARRTSLSVPALLQPGNSAAIDTLELSRRLFPHSRRHTLGAMLAKTGLPMPETAHTAPDDAKSTAALLRVLAPLAAQKSPAIIALKKDPRISRAADMFARRYGAFFHDCRAERNDPACNTTLRLATARAATFFADKGYTGPVENLDYILALIDKITMPGTHLRQQLGAPLHDLATYNQSDLLADDIVTAPVTITTVHKAKGLEMDNVLIYNAARRFDDETAHARLIYVAASRARRRLAIHSTEANIF